MKVGSVVKSFDFHGIENCYMIGKVVGIYEREGTFRAKLIKRVWDGAEDKKFKTDYFTAPLQGEMLRDDRFERVVVLDK